MPVAAVGAGATTVQTAADDMVEAGRLDGEGVASRDRASGGVAGGRGCMPGDPLAR